MAVAIDIGDAKDILAVTHVLPLPQLVERGIFGSSPFYDAYLGSTRLGDRLLQEPRLRVVISGHLHRVADLWIDGVHVVASPVGNVRDNSQSLATLAASRIGVVEIPV